MGRMKEIPAQSVHIVSVNGDEIRPMQAISSGGSVPVYPGPTEFTPWEFSAVPFRIGND